MLVRRSVFAALALLFLTTLSFGLTGGTASAAAVCNKYCDARDPALSAHDRVPVTAGLSGRSLALHFDDDDAMGWASIDNGGAGDEVWLDRSMDGGRTWATGAGWASRRCRPGRAAGAP